MYDMMFYCLLATLCLIYASVSVGQPASHVTSRLHPCDSFYKRVCGQREKDSDGEGQPSKTEIMDQFFQVAVEAYKNQSYGNHPNYVKKSMDFCVNCFKHLGQNDKRMLIKHNLISTLTRSFNFEPFVSAGSYANSSQLWYWMGRMEQEFGQGVLIQSTVERIQRKDCKPQMALQLEPSQAFLEKLEKNEKMNFERVVEFLEALKTVVPSVIRNDLEVKLVAEKVKNFDEDILKFFEGLESSSSLNNFLKPVQIGLKNLTKINKNVDFEEYFKGLLLKGNENWQKDKALFEISPVLTPYLENVPNLIKLDDMKTVALYYLYHIYEKLSPNFFEALDFCTQATINLYPAAITRFVFAKNKWDFDQWRADIQLMAQNILSAFKFMISNSDWLDEQEKVKIIAKANNMQIFPAIPLWIKNETMVEEYTVGMNKSATFFENYFNIQKKMNQMEFQHFKNMKYVEPQPNLLPNPHHHVLHEQVMINLGLVAPPTYHPSYPLAVKYGSLGTTIGHEIMHGFDMNTLEIEEILDRHKILGSKSKNVFKTSVQCLIDQIDSKSNCMERMGQIFCQNGSHTVDEVMSDFDGLKIAYMAYKFNVLTKGRQENISGFQKVTNDQIFFYKFAEGLCNNDDEDFHLITSNEIHGRNMVRVDTVVKNFPLFAAHFNCTIGEPMAPKERCKIWGNFSPKYPAGIFRRRL